VNDKHFLSRKRLCTRPSTAAAVAAALLPICGAARPAFSTWGQRSSSLAPHTMAVVRSLAEYNGVWHVEALSNFPSPATATALLQRAAMIVVPMMQARGWRVKLLSEFYPVNASLLGIHESHGGEVTIRLRLRHASDRASFVPLEGVVRTMLHEVAHFASVRGKRGQTEGGRGQEVAHLHR
jgi:hypothetical protein